MKHATKANTHRAKTPPTLALLVEDVPLHRAEIAAMLRKTYSAESEIICYEGVFEPEPVAEWIDTQLERSPLFENTCLYVDLFWGKMTLSEGPGKPKFIEPENDPFLKFFFCPENVLMRLAEEEICGGLRIVQQYAFKHLRRFYIVVLSAFAMDSFKAFAQKLGADHVIQKYTNLEKLFPEVKLSPGVAPDRQEEMLFWLRISHYKAQLNGLIDQLTQELHRCGLCHFEPEGRTALRIEYSGLSPKFREILYQVRCITSAFNPVTLKRIGRDAKALEIDLKYWSDWMLSAPNRYSKQYFVETALAFSPHGQQLGLLGQGLEPLKKEIQFVGQTDLSVLICGQTGSGKEIIARELHQASSRAAQPFVIINCAGAGSLAGSVLNKGPEESPASAFRALIEMLQKGQGGTAYLDRVGEMPLEMQLQLLHLLEEPEIPANSTAQAARTVRIISSAKQDLGKLVEEGRFVADLYYQLAQYKIEVPPLSARLGDFPEIVKALLEKIAKSEGSSAVAYDPAVVSTLQAYDWDNPCRGGVREMENILRSAILKMKMSGAGRLAASHVTFAINRLSLQTAKEEVAQAAPVEPRGMISHQADLESLRRRYDRSQDLYKDVLCGLVTLGEAGKISQHEARRMLGFKSVDKLHSKLRDLELNNPWSKKQD